MNWQMINLWHKTRLGRFSIFLVGLGASYLFAGLAIDHGNLWYYLLTFLFGIGFIQNLFRLIWPRKL